jgi:hypothetical protein
VLALATVATLGHTAIDAPHAAADTPGCVTRSEFRQVHRGMPKSRVHRIFDTRGFADSGGAGGYTRVYLSCDGVHAIYIEYNALSSPHRLAGKRWTLIDGD